eukprot:2953974-Rhodomonas_salina.4
MEDTQHTIQRMKGLLKEMTEDEKQQEYVFLPKLDGASNWSDLTRRLCRLMASVNEKVEKVKQAHIAEKKARAEEKAKTAGPAHKARNTRRSIDENPESHKHVSVLRCAEHRIVKCCHAVLPLPPAARLIVDGSSASQGRTQDAALLS